jgi:chromosome segregation ATPase
MVYYIMRQQKVSRRRVGKKEAQKLFIEHYKDNILGMIKDVNSRARKTLKLGSKNSWKYRTDPSKYDLTTIDDGSKQAHKWILNQAYHNLANNNHVNIDKSEIQNLKNHLKDEKEKIKNLKDSIDEIKNYKKIIHDDKLRELCDNLNKELNEKLKETQDNVFLLSESLKIANEKITLLKEEHDQNITNAVLKATDNYAKIIEQKTKDFTQQKQQLENKKIQYEEEFQNLQKLLENEKQTTKEKTNKINELKQQINTINEEINTCNETVSKLRNDYKQENEKYKKQSLQNQEQKSKLSEKYSILQNKYDNLVQKLKESENNIKVLQQKVESNQLTSHSIESSQKKLEIALQKHEEYKIKINTLKEKGEILENKLKEKTEKDSEILKDVLNEAAQLKEKIKKIEEELQLHIVEKRELNETTKQLRKEKEIVNATTMAYKARIQVFGSEIKTLKEDIEEFKQRIKIQNQTIEELNKQLKTTQDENKKVQNELKSKITERSEFLQQANDQLALCIQNSKLKDAKITELESEISKLMTPDNTFLKENEVLDEKEKVKFRAIVHQNNNEKILTTISVLIVRTKFGNFQILRLDFVTEGTTQVNIPLIQQLVSVTRIKEYTYKIMFPNEQTNPPYHIKLLNDENESVRAFDIRNKVFMNIMKKNTSFYDNYILGKTIMK